MQETYLRLWTKRHQIADIENAEAYSISVLRRQFYDVKRANRIQEAALDIGQMAVGASTEIHQRLEAADECERIKRMIAQLPQGRVMLMRDVEDKPYKEISAVTGLTEVNIRSILSRARKRIREQIKEMKQ